MNIMLPLARFDNLVIQEFKDEVLVCDLKSNQVFCLNQTAGEVWRLCDGKLSVKDITKILDEKFKESVTEELVLFSLETLSNNNLLVKKVSTKELFAGVSRREVIRRVGLSTVATLPIITAIIMPSAAQAQSGCPAAGGGGPIPNDCACNDCSECDSGCCFNGVCSTSATCNGGFCGATLACSGPFVCCNPARVTNDANCSVCGC